MTATPVGKHELDLRSARQENFTAEDCKYDPHLQEEKLRYDYKQKGTCEITRECDDIRYVDVIVKIKPGQQALDGLKLFQEEGIGGGSIFTGEVDIRKIAGVRKQVASLKAAQPVHIQLYNSVPAVRCDPKSLDTGARKNGENYPGLDGTDVIVGIVDFGCDFRHRNFRRPSGETRILYLWDQTDEKTKRPGIEPPEKYKYGRELTAGMINMALASGDENAYGALDYTPPPASHGTHVLDIAAGSGGEPDLFNGRPGTLPPRPSPAGVAPNAQIIFVDLRSFEETTLGSSRYLLEAVDYIFRKADELNLPAVVNLSLSTTGGPHDGTTLIEQAFEDLVNQRPGRAIVTSAGNSYNLKSHISGSAGRGDKDRATILWATDPRHTEAEENTGGDTESDAQGKNEMEIWYPKGKKLTVSLSAPNGPGKWLSLGSVNLGETKVLMDRVRRVGRISHRRKDPNNDDNQIDIRLPHLDDLSGPWKIELSSPRETVAFHAWIEQSERGLSRFQSETDSEVTLGSISCGNGTITVGAFDTAERATLSPPYEDTSAGRIRSTGKNKGKTLRDKPELSAPGVGIVAARAQGGVTAMSGTSMAAPHVTGLIALLFQLAQKSGRGRLDFDKTCKIITGAAEAVKEGQLRLGTGRIQGASSMRSLLELMVHSVSLDIRLTQAMLTKFLQTPPTYATLFNFLNTNASLTGNKKAKVQEFVDFFKDQVGKSEFFRLTMESLD